MDKILEFIVEISSSQSTKDGNMKNECIKYCA